MQLGGTERFKYGAQTEEEAEMVNPFKQLFQFFGKTNSIQEITVCKFQAYRHHYKKIKNEDANDQRKI